MAHGDPILQWGLALGAAAVVVALIAAPPRGYRVRCSRELAKALGAWFGPYRGRYLLHWQDGWLWWVS
jgi:hypothetical protein